MSAQFGRRAGLFVQQAASMADTRASTRTPGKTLDLSAMHFQFKTSNADEQGPSNCTVRVFNLSPTTVSEVTQHGEGRLVVQAGYQDSYGVIFDGTIKQFRVGKSRATDSYVDILAADGELGYNFAVVNRTLDRASNTPQGVAAAVGEAFAKQGVGFATDMSQFGGIVKPRGKVLFGMARQHMSNLADSLGSSWSIQDGKVVVTPLDGYAPGEAVELTAATGLIGLPESTQSGINVRCLLNPRIRCGGRVKLDNASINRTLAANPLPGGGQLSFNQFAVQFFASENADGMYRTYVVEHEGDTRGPAWYTDLVCLSVDPASGKVAPYG